ncbi:hypothetical protein D3C78_1204120 [compost metagenome]
MAWLIFLSICVYIINSMEIWKYGNMEIWKYGESAAHPRNASDGCIILNLSGRKEINDSSDKILVVED